MIITNNVSFDDFINDVIRILILINSFEHKKSFKLTEQKIKLYDYYLKFPITMLNEVEMQKVNNNFDEYYAFFHWKPEVVRYRKTINCLMAKQLIVRELIDDNVIYRITEKGKEMLSLLDNKAKDLINYSEYIVKNISKLSDFKVEEEIVKKTNILRRSWEG